MTTRTYEDGLEDADILRDYVEDNDLETLRKRVSQLACENFVLAAGQCCVKDGLLGDEGGRQYCTMKQRAERAEDALAAAGSELNDLRVDAGGLKRDLDRAEAAHADALEQWREQEALRKQAEDALAAARPSALALELAQIYGTEPDHHMLNQAQVDRNLLAREILRLAKGEK